MAQSDQLVIDLGTCHTVAVLRRAGQAPRPLLFDGSPLLPSGVYRDVDGALSVGRDAERLSALAPSRFEPYPKRCVDDGAVLLGDAPVPVVELLAALLRRVVAEAAAQQGTPREVTLTCPADWAGQRREVLRAAARAAGLPEVRLVDEPTAAAHYCVEVLGRPVGVGRSLLVFDFGGGTLDVTVVRHDPDGLRVAAVGGLDDLGGVDIDAALVGHLGQLVALRQPQAWRRLVDPHSTGELRDRRLFWTEVRAAKEMLSRTPSAPVQVPGTEDSLHLTREELERVARPLIDRAVDEARRVVDRAGLSPGTLAGILLVGGSSRIPLAASRLHARFGVAPTVPEQPELPVAFGGLLVPPAPPRLPAPPPGTGELSGAPVSVLPYRISPVSGAVWASQGPPAAAARPGPHQRVAAPPVGAVPPRPYAAPAPVGWTPPVAPPVPARRRSPVRPAVITVVVLAVVLALGWGGTKLLRTGARKLGNIAGIGASGGTGGSGSSGSGAKLRAVGAPIDLSGAGAVAVTASTSAVFYSATAGGVTTVYALDPATGAQKWKQDVPIEPAEASLRVVNDLLLVDGEKSASDGGKDMRVVLQAGDGHLLQKLDWSQRADIAYLGSDAIVATAWQPYRTLRVNLRTGKQAWASTPIASINAWHPVKPELTWVAAPGNLPAPDEGFAESLGVNPDRFVQLDASGGAAQVVNGAGKVTVSGKVTVDDDVNDDIWTAFDGLLIGAVNDPASGGKGQVTAYRLDNLKPAWSSPVAFNPGDKVNYVHPCGDHLVCVSYDKQTTDTKSVVAVDTRDGKRLDWSKMPAAQFGDFSTDPFWLVLGGGAVYGESSFPPQIGCESTGIEVVDATNGATVLSLADPGRTRSTTVIGAAGRYAVLRSVTVRGSTTVWQVSLLDLTTGKRSATLDVGGGDNLPQQAAAAGPLMTVIGADRKLYLAAAPSLSP